MKPYIDIVDDIKAASMTKFNGLLQISTNFALFLESCISVCTPPLCTSETKAMRRFVQISLVQENWLRNQVS